MLKLTMKKHVVSQEPGFYSQICHELTLDSGQATQFPRLSIFICKMRGLKYVSSISFWV